MNNPPLDHLGTDNLLGIIGSLIDERAELRVRIGDLEATLAAHEQQRPDHGPIIWESTWGTGNEFTSPHIHTTPLLDHTEALRRYRVRCRIAGVTPPSADEWRAIGSPVRPRGYSDEDFAAETEETWQEWTDAACEEAAAELLRAEQEGVAEGWVEEEDGGEEVDEEKSAPDSETVAKRDTSTSGNPRKTLRTSIDSDNHRPSVH